MESSMEDIVKGEILTCADCEQDFLFPERNYTTDEIYEQITRLLFTMRVLENNKQTEEANKIGVLIEMLRNLQNSSNRHCNQELFEQRNLSFPKKCDLCRTAAKANRCR